MSAGIEQWWPLLPPWTRQWLIEHNGEALTPDVVEVITAAGGVVEDSLLPGESVDWVEATANGETPGGS